jgi:hypothetical protein
MNEENKNTTEKGGITTCGACGKEVPAGVALPYVEDLPYFEELPYFEKTDGTLFGGYVLSCAYLSPCCEAPISIELDFSVPRRLGLTQEEMHAYFIVASSLDAGMMEIWVPSAPSPAFGQAVHNYVEAAGHVTYDGWLPCEEDGAFLQFAYALSDSPS